MPNAQDIIGEPLFPTLPNCGPTCPALHTAYDARNWMCCLGMQSGVVFLFVT